MTEHDPHAHGQQNAPAKHEPDTPGRPGGAATPAAEPPVQDYPKMLYKPPALKTETKAWDEIVVGDKDAEQKEKANGYVEADEMAKQKAEAAKKAEHDTGKH